MKKIIKRHLSFFERASGILGINARNLLFVNRYNTKANKKFADNKMFTKNYLSSRDIGVAKVYAVIKNHKEFQNFDGRSLPNSFVIKPNRGYGGEGIIVIKEKKGSYFIDINNRRYSWRDMYRHVISILDGRYAISGLSDQVIIEEKLEMDDYFTQFTNSGLPDLRVIVFNYVPVIAMLRLPTRESNGKANLHLGAVGIGIDIGSGKATYAVQHGNFVKHLPNGKKINEIKIPDWDEILLLASKAQHVSQIGFLAVDITPTSNGPKILELNARAGLAVQIANQIMLKSRLKKVSDLNVPNPEKGVEVSKTLFSSNIPKDKDPEKKKPIIGLYEYAEILNSSHKNILFKIDPHLDEVILDEDIKNLPDLNGKIEIRLKDKRITLPFKHKSLGKQNYKGILGGKFLKDFLVDLNLKPQKEKNSNKKNNAVEKIISNIDKKVTRIESKINVIGALRPINIDKEKQEFLKNPDTSPRFFYKNIRVDVGMLYKEVNSIPTEVDHPLIKLYKKKIKEIKHKLDILQSINTPELQTNSNILYGKVDRSLYDKAIRYLHSSHIQEDTSKILNDKIIIKKLEKFLKLKKLSKWKISVAPDRTSDIAVNKNGTIFLRDGISFTENRLKAVIMHEICTHIYRLENGSNQKYKMFEKGTANYLMTEEGLAVYNQKILNIALGEKDIWPALRVIGIYLADEMSFVELFHYLKDNYKLSSETAWTTCLKAKRGLVDTNKKIAFTRDAIYFKGYLKIKEYVNNKNNIDDLYVGKIGISDLATIKNIKLNSPQLLPDQNDLEQIFN
jgi:alpha-L-glutamate ligase-like protein/uncharacterized protein (TIGR02421 family)